jgi:hypothetical protein
LDGNPLGTLPAFPVVPVGGKGTFPRFDLDRENPPISDNQQVNFGQASGRRGNESIFKEYPIVGKCHQQEGNQPFPEISFHLIANLFELKNSRSDRAEEAAPQGVADFLPLRRDFAIDAPVKGGFKSG